MRRSIHGAVCVLALVALSATAGAAEAGTKLLRFPDIHGDRVVFAHAGDLWLAPAAGGTATRLTAHPGYEIFPRFSPDGRLVAFTGQYDGDEQVYVVPTSGGVPRQLTFYPARGPLAPRWGWDNQVYDWSADGEKILFRSLRYSKDLSDSKLFLIDADGGLPEALPMPESGAGDLSPDGKRVVYSPLFRDFRTWKRYEGGWAQELYIFDLNDHGLTRVTDHPRADRDPMWIGDTIYFTSDRDGTLNLYAYDVGQASVRQLTDSDTWDVRWPADDGRSRIVYEQNGELVVYDLSRERATPISIDVPNDGVAMRPSRISVSGNVADFELSPKGERALFVARGDIFTAPIEKGATRNLTRSSNAHDKHARWSPDGRRIAFVSDRSGEEELWLIDQAGAGEAEQLTDGGSAMRYAPAWSPDGERLAFSDKEGKLFVLELDGKRLTEVVDEPRFQLFDFSWSPDGGWLAFSLSEEHGNRSIWLWRVADATLHRVTAPTFNEYAPTWGHGGDHLFFFSDREFAPQIGSIEWNYVVDRETYLYALALREDVAHPFWPESDEVELEKEKDQEKGKDKGKDKEESDEEPEPIAVDLEGLGDRVARVPLPADNYAGLAAVEGHLLLSRGAPFYYGRQADVQPALQLFSLEKREVSTLAEDARGWALSADGKKVLVRHPSGFKLYDVKEGADKSAKSVSTAGLVVDRLPAEEWRQIFHEVWRRYRDFFYVENLHGYDWKALREQYEPWLEHVAHRSDLNYVIGEMIAELNVGHAYIQGGDFELPDRPPVGLLGAELELDRKSGRYRIARILTGDNREDRYRAPLTEVGVDVEAGDYLLAIDGEELTATDNPYRLLRHRAGQPIELTLADRPKGERRKVSVLPTGSEQALRYHGWVAANRERVEKMTDGRVGYLHIPDMGADGIREFIKWFYPQIRKQGLVIDVRGNGGGNVSQMIIERLRRELLGIRFSRTSETPGTYPSTVFHGHLVCILDEDSASDGDIFPYRFKKAGLGPLIGKRSWGGVVGITNRGTLIDGGLVFVPEFGTNDVDGAWAVEGYGVDPDIEVDNDPKSLLEGRDPQLERAVAEVLKAIEADPRVFPERPADPVKTR